MASGKRLSVPAFLIPYLDEIGQEIGTDDYTEIVKQVICEHKRFFKRDSGIIQMPTESQVRALEKRPKNLDDDQLASALAGLLDVA